MKPRSSKKNPTPSRRGEALLLRILLTGLTAATALFIFSNSLEDAALSSGRSGMVTALLNGLLETAGLPAVEDGVVRKLAHLSEFCLLGFLSTLTLRAYAPAWRGLLCRPLLGGLLTACLDETIQLFRPGRASSVVDVWIDFAGVCLGLGAAALLLALGRAIRRRKR